MLLARAMALELAETEITVNLIAPGTIEMDLNRADRADPDRRLEMLAKIPRGRPVSPPSGVGASARLE